MPEFIVKKFSNAVAEVINPDNGSVAIPAQPAVFKHTSIVSAIGEDGKEVKVQGTSRNITRESVVGQIADLNALLQEIDKTQ